MAKNIVIIGAGPGGYVCAIRAAQLGNTVTIIDSMKRPGGTCLNMGCIPSKNLLHASHEYYKAGHKFKKLGISVKELAIDIKQLQSQKNQVLDELGQGIQFLFKKNNIRFINAAAQIVSENQVKAGDEILNADAIVVATGSMPRALPNIPVDKSIVLSSTDALDLDHAPKTIAIIGGGYIGLELGSVWSRLGSKIHVIETLDRIAPGLDPDLSQALYTTLEKQGFVFHLSTKIKTIKAEKVSAELLLETSDGTETLTVDKILVSVGRVPNTIGLNLEKIGIETTAQGYIKINTRFETTIKGIYAIGDIVEGPMLAHKAEEEAVALAELLSGIESCVDYNVIPAVVYTQPEVASVGFIESQLQAANIPYKVSKFPFSANSRAKAVHETEGFVKLLSHQETGLVLGAHIIGSCAGTMIAQVVQAMSMHATVEDIARTCHAHPTHSEAIKEAAWAGVYKAIHG
jgi:dihydrolipoamide dehydrogenase